MPRRKRQPRNLVNELRKAFVGEFPEDARDGILFTEQFGDFLTLIQIDGHGSIIGGLAIAKDSVATLAGKLLLLAEGSEALPADVSENHNDEDHGS